MKMSRNENNSIWTPETKWESIYRDSSRCKKEDSTAYNQVKSKDGRYRDQW